MKEYGVYDVKENEQCVYLGNIVEIANYLNCNENSLRCYLTRKKNGQQFLLLRRYELVEINEEDAQIDETIKRKSSREIFNEIIEEFREEIQDYRYLFEMYRSEDYKFEFDYFRDEDFDGEEWKQIGKMNYEISNYGRIKNTQTKKLKALKSQRFGMQVLLWQNSKSYTVTISRMVATMFIRKVKDTERVSHINGNIRDNYYKNLRIVNK